LAIPHYNPRPSTFPLWLGFSRLRSFSQSKFGLRSAGACAASLTDEDEPALQLDTAKREPVAR